MTFTVDHLHRIVGFTMSDEQIAAVTADLERPLLVVAGAGSGKTTVMAARVLWAVGTEQVEPADVVGLTFTRKAAAELSTRVRSLLDNLFEDYPPRGGGIGELGSPVISTYHAFAHQFVAEHGLRIGVEPGARLLSETEALQLAYRVVLNTQYPLRDIGVTPAKLAQIVVNLDQQLSEHVASPEELREHDRRLVDRVAGLEKSVALDRAAADAAQQRIQVSELVEEFRREKQAEDVIDFADVMRFGHELASREDVQSLVHDQVRMVLLDEYQDTSVVQAELLAPLVGPGASVTAVGDPLQAIYSWRGAGANAMADFESHFTAGRNVRVTVLPLSISQRSGANVLAVANDIAAPLRSEATQVVTLQPAVRESGPRRDGVRSALFDTYRAEVEWLGDRIAEQVAAGTDPSAIAVLCRATRDFPEVLDALHRRGIAAAVSGTDGLLSQPEVVDVISILQVISDPAENSAMLRILLGPRMRIGPRDLAVLGERASALAREAARSSKAKSAEASIESGSGAESAGRVDFTEAIRGTDTADLVSLAEAIDDLGSSEDFPYSPQARERLTRLSSELSELRAASTLPLPDLVTRVIAVLGLDVEARLEAMADQGNGGKSAQRGIAAIQALHELVSAAQQSMEDRSLAGFLAWIAVVRRVDREPEFEVPVPPNAVQVMTVHKAKGLEWEVVALPFLSEGVFPSKMPRTRWTQNMRELPHPLRGDRDSLPELVGFGTKAHDRFKEEMEADSDREERRLGYVAVTRPTRLLLASGHWWGPTQSTQRGPSELLHVIHSHCDDPLDVDPWQSESAYPTNPQTDVEAVFSWPPNLDTQARARRLAAAQRVRSLGVRSLSRILGPDGEPVVAGDRVGNGDPAEVLTAREESLVEDWDRDIAMLLAERDFRRSSVDHPLPRTMSASDFMEIQKDELAFLQQRARPMPQRPSRAATRGTRFHTWVEEHLGQRSLFEELPGAADDELFTDEELAELRDGFLRTPYADRIPYAVEVPFSIVVNGLVLKGRIDAVYRDGDRWEMVDWKTNVAATADPTQLAIYRYAWSQMMDVPLSDIVGVFVYVRMSDVVRFEDLPDIAAVVADRTG